MRFDDKSDGQSGMLKRWEKILAGIWLRRALAFVVMPPWVHVYIDIYMYMYKYVYKYTHT